MDDCIFNPLPSAVILRVFVKQLLFFRIAHRCDTWHFESQGGSICVAFCDAILLSADTALRALIQHKQICLQWSPKSVFTQRRITEVVWQRVSGCQACNRKRQTAKLGPMVSWHNELMATCRAEPLATVGIYEHASVPLNVPLCD